MTLDTARVIYLVKGDIRSTTKLMSPVERTIQEISLLVRPFVFLPLISITLSPTLKPACSANEPDSTLITNRPILFSNI